MAGLRLLFFSALIVQATAVAAGIVTRFHTNLDVVPSGPAVAAKLVRGAEAREAAAMPVLWRGTTERGEAVVVRSRVQRQKPDDDDILEVTPAVAVETSRQREVSTYILLLETMRLESFCAARHRDIRLSATPFGGSGRPAGVFVSYNGYGCGMHGSSVVEHRLVVYFGSHGPVSTDLRLGELELFGYANGGVLQRDWETVCQWSKEDFDCDEAHFVYSDWGTLSLGRRFTLLGAKALPIWSSTRPRVASITEVPQVARASVGASILVDDVGVLQEVGRIGSAGSQTVIYAIREREDALTVTFYVVSLESGRTTKVTPNDLQERSPYLTSEKQNEPRPEAFVRFLPTGTTGVFQSSVIAMRGAATQVQVVLTSGSDASLFWLALDSAQPTMPAFAVRVASTAREGEDREKLVTPSVRSFELVGDNGIVLTVAAGWSHDVWGGATCDFEEYASRPDTFDGAATWSPYGFAIALVARPNQSGRVRVTIASDGTLGAEPIITDPERR